MTVIAANREMMVADGMSLIGSERASVSFPKICRLDDDSLVGATGRRSDCWQFMEWLKGNADRPQLADKEAFAGLVLRWDGSIWRFDETLVATPENVDGALIGDSTATRLMIGAMAAGASLVDALQIAINHCVAIGPPIQIERLVVSENEVVD